MQKYMKELKPTVFNDLIAMNALYRPGPIAYIPSFIKRKNGEEPIEYDLRSLRRIAQRHLRHYGLSGTSNAFIPQKTRGHFPKVMPMFCVKRWEKKATRCP